MGFYNISVPSANDVEVAAYNTRRRVLTISNNGAGTVFLSYDQANITTQGTPLAAGGQVVFQTTDGDHPEQAIYAQSAAGNQDIRVYESLTESA